MKRLIFAVVTGFFFAFAAGLLVLLCVAAFNCAQALLMSESPTTMEWIGLSVVGIIAGIIVGCCFYSDTE